MDLTIGIILIASALFLIVTILLQSGKEKGLSGSIGGGSSDTFFGKNKGSTKEKRLSKATTIVAIIFVLVVLVSFIIQDDTDLDEIYSQLTATEAATESVAESESAAGTEAESKEESASAEETAEAEDTDAASDAVSETVAGEDTSAAS